MTYSFIALCGLVSLVLFSAYCILPPLFYSVRMNQPTLVPTVLNQRPQGSVLGPALFTLYMYTTSLSSILTDSFLDYQLCVEHTQLFLSIDSSTFNLALQLAASVLLKFNLRLPVILLRPNSFSLTQINSSKNFTYLCLLSWMNCFLIVLNVYAI